MNPATYVPSFEYSTPYCYFYTVSVGKDIAVFSADIAKLSPKDKIKYLKSNPALSYIYSSWDNQDLVSSCTITKQRNHSDVAEITLTCSPSSAEIILKESGKSGKKLVIHLGFMDKAGEDLTVPYREPASALRSVAYIGITRFPDIKLNSDGTVTLTYRSTSATPNFFTKLEKPLIKGITVGQTLRLVLQPLSLHYDITIDAGAKDDAAKKYTGPLGIPPGKSRWEIAKDVAASQGLDILVGFLPNSTTGRLSCIVYSTKKITQGLLDVALSERAAFSNFSTQNTAHRVSWGEYNSTRNAIEIEFTKEENAAPGSISQGDLGASTPKAINFDAGDGEKIWVLQPKKAKAYINTHGEIAWFNFLASASDEDITKTFYESIDKIRSPSERRKIAAAGTGPSWKAKLKLFQGRPNIIPGNRIALIGVPDPSRKKSGGFVASAIGEVPPSLWLVESVVHRYDSQGFFTEVDMTK